MRWQARRGGRRGQAEFHDWGVRLCGAGIDKWTLPVVDIRYEELDQVRLMAGPINRGVRFYSAAYVPGSVTLLTPAGPEILNQLEEHSAPVNWEPGPFGRNVGT